jgi:hypothetical protein
MAINNNGRKWHGGSESAAKAAWHNGGGAGWRNGINIEMASAKIMA